jgi:hypothetical protein
MSHNARTLAGHLARAAARAAFVALFLTAAFAVVPALSTAADTAPSGASRPVAEGVLIALGLMAMTVGAAIARWTGEEPAS